MFNQFNNSTSNNGADALSNSIRQQMVAAGGTGAENNSDAGAQSGQQQPNQQLLQDNLLLQQQLHQQLQAVSGQPQQVFFPGSLPVNNGGDLQQGMNHGGGGTGIMAGLQGNMNSMASLQGNMNSLANLGRMGSLNASQGNLANAGSGQFQQLQQSKNNGFPGNTGRFANATFNLGMNGSANDLSAVTPSVAATQSSSMNSNLSSMSSAAMFQRLQQAAAASNSSLSGGIPNATFLQQQAQQQNAANSLAEAGVGSLWSERAAGLLGNIMLHSNQTPDGGQPQKQKRIKRKAPKDKPKRPLSAYNIFFKEERARLLAESSEQSAHGKDKRTSSGKIKFESLAKIIGNKWQSLEGEEVEYYKSKAADDMKRYKDQMEVYNNKKKEQGTATTGGASALDDIKEAAGEEPPAGKKQKMA